MIKFHLKNAAMSRWKLDPTFHFHHELKRKQQSLYKAITAKKEEPKAEIKEFSLDGQKIGRCEIGSGRTNSGKKEREMTKPLQKLQPQD